ncbi:hypothetical protein OZX74_08650 [Bifidobacterium sp. ESL0798]|uniref:hypothetical protein n=1 Tax=Bifidobacterium sp. ESL0798 TaxID=2983235 RepID=UPI0023F8ED08|nr:hypothetical protein [Bifidobacterium sp. ESL0798]WEV73930.1 hypothetical protein OZX74_08650 [Bifidobacterium sp. ESL0798]
MNTTTITTQHINHSTASGAAKRSENFGTGRPPPSAARPSMYQIKSNGRPGILGRRQRNRKPDRKDAALEGKRFEQNLPTTRKPNIGVTNVSTVMTPTPVNRSTPMLMSNRDLPGPLSMNRLDDFGALHRLDDISAYLAEYSDTLFGRGIIMTKVVPSHAIACGRSALWVWMGDGFPDVIDIISGSHFRSMAYGRPIKTYDRCVPEGHMSTIAGLKVTSPTRTACDIALMSGATIPGKRRSELICAIMREYHISPAACLTILEKNHFWPNVPQARRFFKAVQYCF